VVAEEGFEPAHPISLPLTRAERLSIELGTLAHLEAELAELRQNKSSYGHPLKGEDKARRERAIFKQRLAIIAAKARVAKLKAENRERKTA